MDTKIIKFYADDGVVLNGYINKGATKTDKVLIETHGMTSNCFKNRESIISEEVEKINIDTICFNNRGSDVAKYIKYADGKKALAGTAYENIEESYYDIIGAIKYAIKLGYSKIYLQGHSLGATKIVYTYNQMKKKNDENLKYIKGIILLSLLDLPYIFNRFSKMEYVEYALEKEKENKDLELMPYDCFVHPISVKNFLQYIKYNEKINFARFSDESYNFQELNCIDVPLFIRWGNNKELIERNAKEQVNFMNKKLNNKIKNIGYIDGANHSFDEKEKELANEIVTFLDNI